MKYLIKYFLRLLLLLTLSTLLAEILHGLYLQHFVNTDSFWAGFFAHFYNQSNKVIYNFITLNIQNFLVVKWLIWLVFFKPYYIVLFLIASILYYRYRQNSLKQPLIITHRATQVDRYQQQKKENTQREVNRLVDSPQFKNYEKDKFFDRLQKNQNDPVYHQLQQKEHQFF